MKKKIFSLLLIFTMFFGIAFTSAEAQAEFIDDNTFVVSNNDDTMNEDDIKELFLFFIDYVETYEIPSDILNSYDIGNNLYGGLSFDFQADLSSLAYRVELLTDDIDNVYLFRMWDYEDNVIVQVYWDMNEDDIGITGIATTYLFTVVINLTQPEPEPPLTIFGFFNNFYSNYIFPNNLLDTQTLNLITAVTTLLFFIGVFRGIYSIFRSKRK